MKLENVEETECAKEHKGGNDNINTYAEKSVDERVEEDELEEGEITDDDDLDNISVEMQQCKREQNFGNVSNASVLKELRDIAERGNKETTDLLRSQSFFPRSRSRSMSSRSRSRSPQHQYYHHHQYRRRSESRSKSPPRRKQSQWIPVTPCSIQEDVEVGSMSSMMVPIKAKGEFSFKDNAGCMVRITKWTGKDAVSNIHVRPQIVHLSNSSYVLICVDNTYQDRSISLHKHDKIACLSILSAPTPSRMFSSLSCSPDRLQTGERRWFKVTTVVLHKKGSLDRISIQPGKTLKVIGTVIGPLKKHVGKVVG